MRDRLPPKDMSVSWLPALFGNLPLPATLCHQDISFCTKANTALRILKCSIQPSFQWLFCQLKLDQPVVSASTYSGRKHLWDQLNAIAVSQPTMLMYLMNDMSYFADYQSLPTAAF